MPHEHHPHLSLSHINTMASTGVNVLRWSALGGGLFYGLYHQSTIKAADKLAASRAEYERKENLIQQAKAAYVKKTQPQDKFNSGCEFLSSKTPARITISGTLGMLQGHWTDTIAVITDPEDPKFDLEKYVAAKVEA